jgi:SAM-dependent methyltransferase
VTRRKQHVPWRAAGAAAELQHSADEVVRTTGWVFNNETGDHLDLASFVNSGDHEVGAYIQAFGLPQPSADGGSSGSETAGTSPMTMVEIGCGIGRMTAAFSRTYQRVLACDLDAAFLERCRETVAQFGRPEHLYTVHVADGHTLHIDDDVSSLTFSYITLQHCHRADAVRLTREAIRVTQPGGVVALNFRTWTAADILLWPAGKLVRALFRIPQLGERLARWRATARLGWQANRLAPRYIIDQVATTLDDVRIFRNPGRRPFQVGSVSEGVFEGVHRSHWWLIATVH